MLLPARTGAAGVARKGPAPGPLGLAPETWLLLAITIAAAVLRFATISAQSYWVDESQAAHEMQLSFGAMLRAWSGFEWNPPLYFVLLWPWAKLFGTGSTALRSLSAVLGTGLVPLLYLCGRELVSRRAGLVAALLTAFSPLMIWYSQEAREYMLLLVLCAGSMLLFARAWRAPSRRVVLWWAVVSALALLTQYFAGFLIAAEGLLLVQRHRSRLTMVALGAMGVVELALLPHVLPQLRQPAAFIVGIPLSIRIQQVPVTFAMNTLYRSSLVSYGLIGAAILAAALIALLVIGADAAELRGVALAAALAAAVLLVPLVVALLGHDDYIARGLMPAWIPLAIVLGAASTPAHARSAGALLAVVLLAMFVYAGIRIGGDARFQRPDWRGVAAALGRPGHARAIVAADGEFATGPLSIYLPGSPWSGPGQSPPTPAPITVAEVDVVASPSDAIAKLAPGVRLIASRTVGGYRVDRFSLSSPWRQSAASIGARAVALMSNAPAGTTVMIQRPPA